MGEVSLLGPGVLARGEGTAVNFLKGSFPPSWHHPVHPLGMMCPLDWGYLPSMWGGGVSTTTGFSLFWVEFINLCPDVSNTAWVKSSLISVVMLTSSSTFGRVALMELAIGVEG